MKRINILFDASIIIEHLNSRDSGRSGVYWVAYNILRHLSQNSQYKITLLVPPLTFFIKKDELRKFLSSFAAVNIVEKSRFDLIIKAHKYHIKNNKNIIFIGIKYMKILINIFLSSLLNSLPQYKYFNNFNAFFSPFYAIPDKIKNIPSIKIFHFLHDCIPFLNNIHTMNINFNQWFVQLANGLNSETFYFCNSLNTKNDFLKLFPNQLDENKLMIIPLASSHNFFLDYDKINLIKVFNKYGVKLKTDDIYIFTIGNIDPRKNIIFTLKCFIKFIQNNKIDNIYFCLGGGFFKDYANQFIHEISSFGKYNEKIIMLGYIDDEDINVLLSNSLFFTFLSQYEGFGIPLLEAMQAGTPVICSNNSSLPEVVGDAAITIDYNSEEQCIKAFENLYFDESLRKQYIEKGLERAKLFSWEKTVNRMTEVITKVLS